MIDFIREMWRTIKFVTAYFLVMSALFILASLILTGSVKWK